ncbi:hypothetical protein MPER_16172, partial [Moniliophthora perniciosa FA553]
DGPITAPFLNEGDKNGSTHRNWNITRMFTFQHHLDNTKVLTGLILPKCAIRHSLKPSLIMNPFDFTAKPPLPSSRESSAFMFLLSRFSPPQTIPVLTLMHLY